jgi:hypothetical protein
MEIPHFAVVGYSKSLGDAIIGVLPLRSSQSGKE